MRKMLFTAVLAAVFACAAQAQPYDELTPKGNLRVAIAVSPAPSALYAIRDAAGQYPGVTVDLGNALAAQIGRPVQLVAYPATGEIVAAGDADAWDVTFMLHETQRARAIDFGSAYHLQQSTFLLAGHNGIRRPDEVDRAGIRIAGVEGAATARAAALYLKQASLITVRGVAEALMKEGKAEGIALGRESLLGLQRQLPGAHLLEESFLQTADGRGGAERPDQGAGLCQRLHRGTEGGWQRAPVAGCHGTDQRGCRTCRAATLVPLRGDSGALLPAPCSTILPRPFSRRPAWLRWPSA